MSHVQPLSVSSPWRGTVVEPAYADSLFGSASRSEQRRGDRPLTRGFEPRRRYGRSEKGHARHGRYNNSQKGHARRQRYERSDHGQYMRSKYEASAARMLAAVRSNAKRRGQR